MLRDSPWGDMPTKCGQSWVLGLVARKMSRTAAKAAELVYGTIRV